MKKYLVYYYKDFGNTYVLRWVDNEEDFEAAKSEGFERITKKKAVELCRDERYRLKYEYNSAGFADSCVYPYGDREWSKMTKDYICY